MRKSLALIPLLLPVLAQVGLLDGPRPSTEVRGYLEGNAQEGYRVRVEFLLETGTNPTQGTTYQPLGWNGRLYLCPGACDTFTLSGFSPGTSPNGQAYNLYDSQNRLRGKAGVTTIMDAHNRPQQYRVDYAVWPLSGTKTWQASPDNPVPLETGGWLTARPPGGSPERYRYPGMESYQPPTGGSLFAGISPADRDLAQKSLIDSLAKLRAFLGRQPRNGEAWFFVPEVTPWTLQLAQEFQARVGGPVRFVVPEGTATSYCPTGYRSDPRFHVLPRPSLDKKDALAVIWPPSGPGQKGAAMAGRYLVDRPDWPDGPNCLGQTLNLVPTAAGLPEARAYLYGCISQANLKARVEFKEVALGNPGYVGYRIYEGGWNGRVSFNLGNGNEEVRITLPSPAPTDWTRVEPVRDAKDRDRGYAYVKATVWGAWVLYYEVYWYLSRWQTTWRAATDNDRPVEAGGYVTAEGRRYRIPGLEGYLQPQGKEIEAVEGDPYVTYLTRSLLPNWNPYAALNREEGKVWYKPLSQWCQERGK